MMWVFCLISAASTLLRLVLKKDLLLIGTFKMADVYLFLVWCAVRIMCLSDCKYEKIIILSVVMMRNDIIISLD